MAFQKNVYVICGPTAVGKTAIAISLAQRLQTAIVSADSRQCYREMTIGTAKPTPAELSLVKHYFINEFPVATALSAADFEKLALGYLADIFQNNDNAVLCGGTGLYIKALCEGLDEMPAVDEGISTAINAQYLQEGLQWLQAAVEAEDPAYYAAGETKNPARLLRALIFMRSTGRSITAFQSRSGKARPFHIIKIGLELPRELLYERINNRVDKMMKEGLLQEVEKLYPLRHLKNLQTLGYTELFAYMDGKYPLGEAVKQIKQNTRHYAKRQMTWFKKDMEIKWLSADTEDITAHILK